MQPEHTTPEPAYQFPGFYRPRFTQVPDSLFDELMPHLTGGELKVALYIIRRTYGFKKDSDDIGLDQLTEGIKTRDGRALDHGTGLARSTVVGAVKGLLAKGVIVAHRNQTPDGGDLPTTFSLHERGESENRTLEGTENRPQGVAESYPQDTVKRQRTRKTEGSRHVDRAAPVVDAADRNLIATYVDDFRRELGDHSGQARALGQIVNLYAKSGLSVTDFLVEVYDARQAAKAKVGAENRWAYFYKVLAEKVGE